MQKIWLQIGFTDDNLRRIHAFRLENQCKNESQAVNGIIEAHSRLQFVIMQLEKKAHEAENWKLEAEKEDGTGMKRTIAIDVKKNTGSKAKSGKNTSGIQKQGGKH